MSAKGKNEHDQFDPPGPGVPDSTKEKQKCGIVMPISTCDGCSESHWADVRQIITEAVLIADFEANLVSDADDVGIIHKRIVQNLYDNPIVVCDVSGKNPNVMFELGMRLAFDKPTIIIKDDKTSYSFDTSGIEHLEYPRDLRFGRIVDFKAKLAHKIRSTHERAQSDTGFTTFLKHFGEFTVAKIEKKEVTGMEFLMQEIKSMNAALQRMERSSRDSLDDATASSQGGRYELCLLRRTYDEFRSSSIFHMFRMHGVQQVVPKRRRCPLVDGVHQHIEVLANPLFEVARLNDLTTNLTLWATSLDEAKSDPAP